MIHLDTNYLIGLATLDSKLRPHLESWLRSGETLATSAVAWCEFMTGPATRKQVDDVAAMIGEKIVPLGAVEAALAAQLYNRAGRKAALRLDSMIAATAICSAASLATANRKDFSPFTPSGLRLI